MVRIPSGLSLTKHDGISVATTMEHELRNIGQER
jgi:hypothetical protein